MVRYGRSQVIGAAAAAASQQLRREVRIAFDRAAQARADRHRPKSFRVFLAEASNWSAPQVREPAGCEGENENQPAERPATPLLAERARTFIFTTAGDADDGRDVSTAYRTALQRVHPDSAGGDAADDAGAAIELLRRARQALQDAGLWS